MSIAATYVSATSFTLSGDLSSEIVAGMRVQADCGTDGTFLGTVSTSEYASGTGLTTVTLAMDSGSLTANLATVLHGNDSSDSICRASTTLCGGVFLATDAMAIAGTDTTSPVPPSGLAAAIEDKLPYANFFGYTYAATYVSTTSFTLSGDKTSTFVVGVKVRADCGADGIKLGVITSSTYASGTGLTTIVLAMDSSTLTSNLVGVRPGSTKTDSLANHSHAGTESGGALSGYASLSATNNFQDNTVQRATFKDSAETLQALGTISSATTINLENGNVATATLGASITITFSNPPASGSEGMLLLILTNGGAYTITWGSTIYWPSGTAPTLTASGVDYLLFTTTNGGTSWRGASITGYTA